MLNLEKLPPDYRRVRFHRAFALHGSVITSNHSALHLSELYDRRTIERLELNEEDLRQLEWLLQLIYDRAAQDWSVPTAEELKVLGTAPPGACIMLDRCVFFRGMD